MTYYVAKKFFVYGSRKGLLGWFASDRLYRSFFPSFRKIGLPDLWLSTDRSTDHVYIVFLPLRRKDSPGSHLQALHPWFFLSQRRELDDWISFTNPRGINKPLISKHQANRESFQPLHISRRAYFWMRTLLNVLFVQSRITRYLYIYENFQFSSVDPSIFI